MKWRTLLAVISNNCLVSELAPLSELTPGDGMGADNKYLLDKRRWRISRFIQLRKVIYDEAEGRVVYYFARLNKSRYPPSPRPINILSSTYNDQCM